MELKRLVQQCVYRIEPKAEGGFIARASDPNVPPLEAATREELQQKIQAKLVAAISEAFPGFQLPQQGTQVSVAMHVDRKPGGGFTVHSDNPGTPGFNPAAQEKFDQYAEELLGFVDKHFPHLSEQIASQVTGREIQVFTSRTVSTSGKLNSMSPMLLPTQPMQSPEDMGQQATPSTTTTGNTDISPALLTNTPITPDATKVNPIVRFLVTLLILAAVMYFFFYRR